MHTSKESPSRAAKLPKSGLHVLMVLTGPYACTDRLRFKKFGNVPRACKERSNYGSRDAEN